MGACVPRRILKEELVVGSHPDGAIARLIAQSLQPPVPRRRLHRKALNPIAQPLEKSPLPLRERVG
jgi:hypothetical protein